LYQYVPLRNQQGEVETGLILAQNVTERYRAGLAVAKREREFRTLTENLPDLVARFDRDQRYVYVNPVFEAATSIPLGVALGKSNGELGMEPASLARWRRPFSAFSTSTSPRASNRISRDPTVRAPGRHGSSPNERSPGRSTRS
jgi:PAS domain-containing protein